VKYSPQKSEIKITIEKIKKQAVIEVVDRGIGIKKKEIQHIFDRFYRADSSRCKNNADGYGLGLSIAKSIVDLHNGEIKVESKSGKGSKFRVILPI
jgi:signal transduction histidine kinase